MLRRGLACLTLLLPLVFAPGVGAVEWETKADLRERVQIFDNFNFNDSVDADKWEWDSRLYLKVGARFSDSFRLYFQPQGIFIYTDMDSAGGDGDTEFSQVDFYQLFLEYKKDAVGLKLVANYSVFLAGDAVEERNGGHDDNASFVYLIAQYAS